MAHVTYGQDIDYMNQMPTMKEMRRLNAAGRLKGPEAFYFLPTKPVEELYDTTSDPHEIHNLAGDPKYEDVLRRMRRVLMKWMKETGDVGLIPEPDFDEMKRPGGRFEQTAEPGFVAGDKPHTVAVSCPTPGASIAYRTDGKNGRIGWKLYSKPVMLERGQVLKAKACRIGFKDSKVVEYRLGDSVSTTEQPSSKAMLHWRERLDQTDLLDRLLAIKSLDGQGDKAIPAYLNALEDKYGPVRYWAVVGLHNACNDAEAIDKARPALVKMLDDSSPSVAIAAAHALCDWDREAQALPVLVDAMKHGRDNVRLYAAIALGKIGEKARPAISEIKAAMKDKYKYVARVNKYTLMRFGEEPPKEHGKN